ncbi:Dihydropteroate synthase [Paraconexibacter sp. AEG42_29]|uniref:dihydropteroate synthase n=1 Tax=Paraconexibacter sp. AEG42_29 TaxID=2997339 RepID=A0AAU7AUG2_9ACTN
MDVRIPGGLLSLEPGRPALMGIVNANPDSFSDAVRLTALEQQLAHARQLIADGASIIDVGGESGVTYTGVTADQVEIDRVVPLVERLAADGVVVSVDTWKPAVAEAAIAAGAAILNDVSGLRDERLAAICARTGAALVVMHTRAAPKQEHFHDYDGDVAGDVVRFLAERCAVARAAGVDDEQLILDPGPDFAKTPGETVQSLHAIDTVNALGRPVLHAVSRKYFVGAITGQAPADRGAGTLAAAGWSADHGAAILRVHDVRATADFLAVKGVLDGRDPMPSFDSGDDRLKWIRAAPQSTP